MGDQCSWEEESLVLSYTRIVRRRMRGAADFGARLFALVRYLLSTSWAELSWLRCSAGRTAVASVSISTSVS